jgi:hypothetical protein
VIEALVVQEVPMPWAKEVPVMQVQDGSDTTFLPNMPTQVDPNTDDALLGSVGVWADGPDPWPGNNVRSLCHDLVVHGASPSAPEHTALGDAVSAPEFPSATSLG